MNSSALAISIRISGGIGNQLFQLSAGLYVSNKFQNSNVYIDSGKLSSYQTPRNLDIKFFIDLFPHVKISRYPGLISSIASKLRLSRFIDSSVLKYGFISSSNSLINISNSNKLILLDGYFQDPSIASAIFSCNNLYKKIESEFASLKSQILEMNNQEVVGIHIRRGDYVSSSAASSVFNTISLSYYREAVSMFSTDVKFFVFGDDEVIVSNFANEIGGVCIPAYNFSTIQEFMLLILCDHYIIANSTFSWWASYLGWNENKCVISPKNWYRDNLRNFRNPLLLRYFKVLDNDI